MIWFCSKDASLLAFRMLLHLTIFVFVLSFLFESSVLSEVFKICSVVICVTRVVQTYQSFVLKFQSHEHVKYECDVKHDPRLWIQYLVVHNRTFFNIWFSSQKLLNIVCCNNEVGSHGLDRQCNAGWHCDGHNCELKIMKILK